MKVTESLWVARNGSIYTEETVKMRSEFPGNKTSYDIPVSIAFNVGQAVAEHICETHNAHVMWKRENQPVRYIDGTAVNDTNQGTK